jgi:hypothetical protein
MSNVDKPIVTTIQAMIVESGINENAFYQAFQDKPLSREKVKKFFQ